MNIKGNFWKYFFKFVFNKYTIVMLVFLVYLIFFDDNNLIRRWKQSKDIDGLKKELKYYQDEIELHKKMVDQLKNDTAYLEKFAREKYYLKKNDEEIFIVK